MLGPHVVSFAAAVACFAACAPTAGAPRATTPATAAPQPAIPALLAAFDHHQVVALPAGHGMKDLDDFILALVRDPRFPERVNDIAVECGNSRHQAVLDRYIAGAEVPFTEVRKVWRDTTQSMMCSRSAFYEQLFPLVRAINQRLPAGKRLRVLAADPPIDWDEVRTADDAWRYFQRDATIAAVMEAQVLSRRRKALMLFGTFHLLHGQPLSAVSIYEQRYPQATFVISDLGNYDSRRLASWTAPSLAPTRGSWLGALSPAAIWDPGTRMIDCKVLPGFPPELQVPVEDVVDAFLYLGPRELRLAEQTPADIALDHAYMTELQRREALTAFPGAPPRTLAAMHAEILDEAQRTLLAGPPPPPDIAALEASCRAQHPAPAPAPPR